jgi:hypothetical protein
MWAYSLSLGGSHALLNDWVNNERLMNLLTRKKGARWTRHAAGRLGASPPRIG